MPRPPRQRDAARRDFGFWILDFGLEERHLNRLQAPPATSKIQNPKSKIAAPRGLTLIEMLIATAITLLMMAAVVNLFANLSGSIRNRRAVIELSSQIRQVRQRLTRDLAGCTVPLKPAGLVPWQRAGEGIGYFEIIEGEQSDTDPSDLLDDRDPEDGYPDGIDEDTSLIPTDNAGQLVQRDNSGDIIGKVNGLGDFDDILALTVQSDDQPFTGLYQLPDQTKSGESMFPDPTNDSHWIRVPVESNLAEVVWYAGENPADGSLGEPGMRRIYRRAVPIAPILPDNVNTMRGYNVSLSAFQQYNDLSVRRDRSSSNIELNTLADLTRREYRYGRGGGSEFPFPFENNRLSNDPKYLVLNDALAFDVRVYDPGAPVYTVSGGVLVQPGDPAWDAEADKDRVDTTYSPVTYGAYVDLGWDNAGGPGGLLSPNYVPDVPTAPQALFQQQHEAGWHPVLPNAGRTRGAPAVYDTWSWHYENDGQDQDDSAPGPPPNDNPNNNSDDSNPNTGAIDEGKNGRDDAYIPPGGSTAQFLNGVDDPLEYETSPPYPVPLRGVKVIFRTYERDARQVREASVTHSFIP
jgi:prepilin-type N-terminal cleavage/methylation domain-containing protein